MLCIHITCRADGYTSIRVSDVTGIPMVYAGWDNWPALRLLEEHGIDIR